jgi:predicted amidophosphoribosyltransferase
MSSNGDEEETGFCPHCGAEVYLYADRCPVCGDYITPTSERAGVRRWRALVLAIIALITLVAFLFLIVLD